jgi:hypothetical protein
MLLVVAWIVLTLVHTPPALAAFSPRLRKRLYGVSEDASLGVILTHRGVLFLAVAVACAYAAVDADARRLATIIAAISMLGFLAAYAAAGRPKGQLRAIALIDLIATPALAFVIFDAWF